MANSVAIQPIVNSVTITLFDAHTIAHFLSPITMLEEHRKVGVGDA